MRFVSVLLEVLLESVTWSSSLPTPAGASRRPPSWPSVLHCRFLCCIGLDDFPTPWVGHIRRWWGSGTPRESSHFSLPPTRLPGLVVRVMRLVQRRARSHLVSLCALLLDSACWPQHMCERASPPPRFTILGMLWYSLINDPVYSWRCPTPGSRVVLRISP